MDFIIHLSMMREWPYTTSSQDVLGWKSPKTLMFPSALEISLRLRPWDISRASENLLVLGDVQPNSIHSSSRQCTDKRLMLTPLALHQNHVDLVVQMCWAIFDVLYLVVPMSYSVPAGAHLDRFVPINYSVRAEAHLYRFVPMNYSVPAKAHFCTVVPLNYAVPAGAHLYLVALMKYSVPAKVHFIQVCTNELFCTSQGTLMQGAVTVGKSRAGRWGEKILMWGENSDSGSIITEWRNSKLFASCANSNLQSNQGLFCLWQYSTVTKKAADGKSGLKLADLKRCRDTRHRALLGKAGIRGWSEVGPAANRF